MDENYLDNLLNELSLDKEIDHTIEEELDSQIQEEKEKRQKESAISREEAFDMELEKESDIIAEDQDLLFSEEQIDELDQLDNLADLDIGDLDFSDIDFNDLDVTKLGDIGENDFDDILKEFEGDLQIDGFFDEEEHETERQAKDLAAEEESFQDSFTFSEDDSDVLKESDAKPVKSEALAEEDVQENADLNADSFDADAFLNNLLDETEQEESGKQPIEELPMESGEQQKIDLTNERKSETESNESIDFDTDADIYGAMEQMDGFADFGQKVDQEKDDSVQELSKSENDELEDLFSMLDLNDPVESDHTNSSDAENAELVEQEKTVDNADSSEAPQKKKTFMQILFGDPDEDDILTEEEIAAIEAKKAEKKAKKQAAKDAKQEKAEISKQKKDVKNAKKKQAANEKKKIKAEKKAKQRAEELANAEPEKKLNKPAVVFIFTLFLGGTCMFYLATNNFNYTQAIEKATNYFANQRYRKAYDEIVGVEVKEKDEDLKDRIYTVMYVERLYESYENNIRLGRSERALDSLLRGVDKYYEHYEEAEELGIVSDLDYSFVQIKEALLGQYGITVEQAVEINAMENYQYVEALNSYIAQQNAIPMEESNE